MSVLHRNGEAIGRANERFKKPSGGKELVAGDTGEVDIEYKKNNPKREGAKAKRLHM